MSKREKEIRLKVTEEEYETIFHKANKLNMQVAPYIRMVAQQPTIIYHDYRIISSHTREIAEVRNAINRLVFTIDASNNYLPKDIESIVDMMNQILKSENELIRTVRRQTRPGNDEYDFEEN